MALFDKLAKIGNVLEQATKYSGTQPVENKEVQEFASLGQNIADTLEKNTQINKVLPVSLGEMVALGGTFAMLAPTLQSMAKDVSRNGLANIPVKNIATDALKQAGADISPLTNVVGGIAPGTAIPANPISATPAAVPNPLSNPAALAINPATLMMAAMLVTIEKKLDDIKVTQESILSFLEVDKQAEQQANLKFLEDTLSGYKYNYENAQYRQNHHVKALDIKQTADKNIWFYFSRISDELMKIPSFQMDQAAKAKIQNLESMMDEYRLAIYEFGFSSFLEMLLLGNFQQEYLNQIAERIVKYNNEYKTLFTGSEETGSSIFVSGIKNIAAINNQTKDISFDGENMYLNLE